MIASPLIPKSGRVSYVTMFIRRSLDALYPLICEPRGLLVRHSLIPCEFVPTSHRAKLFGNSISSDYFGAQAALFKQN